MCLAVGQSHSQADYEAASPAKVPGARWCRRAPTVMGLLSISMNLSSWKARVQC